MKGVCKMKLKENKGMSLIIFSIILAILVLVLVVVIVYLLKNPVKEQRLINRTVNIEVNQLENKTENSQIIKKLTDGEKANINKILSLSLNLSAIQSTNTLMSNILKRRRNIKQ